LPFKNVFIMVNLINKRENNDKRTLVDPNGWIFD
jgi:hypothetical protein